MIDWGDWVAHCEQRQNGPLNHLNQSLISTLKFTMQLSYPVGRQDMIATNQVTWYHSVKTHISPWVPRSESSTLSCIAPPKMARPKTKDGLAEDVLAEDGSIPQGWRWLGRRWLGRRWLGRRWLNSSRPKMARLKMARPKIANWKGKGGERVSELQQCKNYGRK